MKNILHKKKRILLLGIMAISIFSSKAQDATVYAYAFTREPIIDGHVEKDWYDNEFLEISKSPTGQMPASKEDFSGRFKIGWYNNDLYFLFEVDDDTLKLNEGYLIWLGDNINLYLDLGNEKNFEYDNNDYLCHFKWGNSEYYERYDSHDLIKVDNSKYAVEFAQFCDTLKHYYVMEIAIHNLAELNGPAVLDESVTIGLDVGIYDCDDGDPCFYTHQLSWFDTTGYAWSDPSKLGTAGFGTVKLKAAKAVNSHALQYDLNPVKIIPTVASNTLNISSYSKNELLVNIFDLYGRKMGSYSLASENTSIDISSLNPGLYIVQVSDSGGLLSSQKIIKNR